MKNILLLLLMLFASLLSQAQDTSYRSKGNGDWNNPSTWQYTIGGSGIWIDADISYPTSSAGSITIKDSVVVTENVSVDQVVIVSGGILHLLDTLIVANGSGTDLDVKDYGKLYLKGDPATLRLEDNTYLVVAGTLIMRSNSGGISKFSYSSGGGQSTFFDDGCKFYYNQNGGLLPSVTQTTYSPNSTIYFTGLTSARPTNMTEPFNFGNIEYDCQSQTGTFGFAAGQPRCQGNFLLKSTGTTGILRFGTGNNATVPIQGNFSVTGGTLFITESGSRRLNIGGDFSVAGGKLVLTTGSGYDTLVVAKNFSMTGGILDLSSGETNTGTGRGFIYIKGNYTHSGGTIRKSNTAGGSSGSILFNGTSQVIAASGILTGGISIAVNNGDTLLLGANAFGANYSADFSVPSGATLGLGHTQGITTSGATGNVQVSGTRSFNSAANYIYTGSGDQVTGAGLPANVNDLAIETANSSQVTLSQSVNVDGVLKLTAGRIATSTDQVKVTSTGSISGGSSSSYVNGNLVRVISTGNNTFSYPVGTGSGYTPLSIAFNGVTSAREVTAYSTDGVSLNYPSSLSSSKRLARHWVISSAGSLGAFTADVAANYLAGDLTGGATSSSLKVYKYDVGATPAYTFASYTTGTNTFTANGITSFSEFGAGECPVISAPTTTGDTICIAGYDTIIASGAGAGQDYKWYDAATGGTLLQQGNDSLFVNVSLATDYYVSIYDTSSLCESARTKVTADVGDFYGPVITLPTLAPTYPTTRDSCSRKLTLGATATDNCPGSLEITYQIQRVSGGDSLQIMSFPYEFVKGSTKVKVYAEDASSNISTDSFTVVVTDTTRPVITLPTLDPAYPTTRDSCSRQLTLVATVTDNCPGIVQISYQIQSSGGVDSVAITSFPYMFAKGSTKVKVYARDSSLNLQTDSFTVEVTDTTKPVISCKSNLFTITDAGQLYHTASGGEFDLGSSGDNCLYDLYYKLTGVTTTTSPEWIKSSTLNGAQFNFGVTTITWKAIDESGNSVTCSFEVNVDTVQTTIRVGDIVVTPTTKQYSDSVVISARVTPWPSAPVSPLTAPSGKMVFYIGSEKMGEASVSDVAPTDEVGYAEIRVPLLELQTILNYSNYHSGYPTNGPLKPGIKDVRAVFVSTNTDDYLNDTTVNPGVLQVAKEEAIILVDNTDAYFSASPTTFKGTVWFKAKVSDTTDTAPIPSQGARGDIRNATLQFLDGSGGLPGIPIASARNVGLFNASDKTTGQSLLTFDYTLNNTEIQAGGKSWIALAEAGNYYTGYDVRDANVVTLGLPGSDFVTGGGYYMTEQSGGLYSAQNGTRMNFGFNMKWNKTGKNLQGKINVIYRTLQNGKVRIFHIKSNAVDALGVSSTTYTDIDGISRQYSTALMTTQASLTDITDPYNPIGYSGNNNLKVVAWDSKLNGSSGEWDKISVELYDSKTSQLMFASYTGGGTVSVRTIKTGNINVRNTSTVLTPDCAAPTNLTVGDSYANSATLGWTSGSGSLGDTLMYRKYGVGASWTFLLVPSGTPSQTITTHPGTLYEWRVKSVCSAGSSAWVYGSFTSLADCNAMPTQLQASDVTTSSANLAWSVNTAATGYKLKYRIWGSATFTEVNTVTNSYNLTGMDDDTTYEWQVSNTCSSGTSGTTSAMSQFKTLSACATQNLVATGITAMGARLNWDRALAATAYAIRWKDTSAAAPWNTITGVVNNYYDLVGLNPATVYQFEVAPVCTGGKWATSALFTTLSACGTPSGLQTLNITYTGATFQWNAVSYATGYTVRYRSVNTTTWTETGLLANTTTSYAVIGLMPQTGYEWSVKATCAAGEGSWSSAPGFTTQGLCTPTALQATTSTSSTTSATLTWSGPVDATFNLDYKKSSVATWTSVNNLAASSYPYTYPLTGLSKNTIYNWRVTAICNSITGGTTNGNNFKTGTGLTYQKVAGLEFVTLTDADVKAARVRAFPNPNKGKFNLLLSGFEEGQVGLNVTDVYGRVMYSKQHYLKECIGIIPVDICGSSNGIYMLQVIQQHRIQVLKLRKE